MLTVERILNRERRSSFKIIINRRTSTQMLKPYYKKSCLFEYLNKTNHMYQQSGSKEKC